MSRKAPAFQLYADDFLAGTLGMSDEEKGVYITMLCLQWTKGGLGERELRAAGNENAVNYVVNEKFEQGNDGKYRNPRLAKMKEISELRKQNGSKGGSKTQANVKQTVKQNAKQKAPPPTPSPTPSPSNTHTHTGADGFEREWERWVEYRFSVDGRVMGEVEQEANLMELRRRGPEKAKRDLEFSIRKGARSVLDSSNDFEQRKRATRSSIDV